MRFANKRDYLFTVVMNCVLVSSRPCFASGIKLSEIQSLKEIKGDDIKVRSVDIKNVKTGGVTNHEFGVFIYVGLDPVSVMSGLDITDQDGFG